jgi:hypothetical protein
LATLELKRKGAKIAKGIIVENKRFLCAFASLRFKHSWQFHCLNGLRTAEGQPGIGNFAAGDMFVVSERKLDHAFKLR